MIEKIKNKYLRRFVLILIIPIMPFLVIITMVYEDLLKTINDYLDSFISIWNQK